MLSFYHHSDKVIFFSAVVSIGCILAIINLFAVFYPELPHLIPLFYSLPWGDDELATLPQFILLPFIILLIILINYSLLWHLHHTQVVLKRFLALSAAVAALLLTITAFRIVFIFI